MLNNSKLHYPFIKRHELKCTDIKRNFLLSIIILFYNYTM
ncbi:hypothetical protein D1BOALGB6SA_5416 [Olavius sp. associated proteobacterium Delta 1]|nr:hypothetical protein D1BOALGB6SA_5416 [Olavius sp. associated proteobacterium Delta 1]